MRACNPSPDEFSSSRVILCGAFGWCHPARSELPMRYHLWDINSSTRTSLMQNHHDKQMKHQGIPFQSGQLFALRIHHELRLPHWAVAVPMGRPWLDLLADLTKQWMICCGPASHFLAGWTCFPMFNHIWGNEALITHAHTGHTHTHIMYIYIYYM